MDVLHVQLKEGALVNVTGSSIPVKMSFLGEAGEKGSRILFPSSAFVILSIHPSSTTNWLICTRNSTIPGYFLSLTHKTLELGTEIDTEHHMISDVDNFPVITLVSPR